MEPNSRNKQNFDQQKVHVWELIEAFICHFPMLGGSLMDKRGTEEGTRVDKHQATGHKHQIYIHSES